MLSVEQITTIQAKNTNVKNDFLRIKIEFIWKLTFACSLNERRKNRTNKKKSDSFTTDGYQMVQ